jgi:K+ transporter
VLAVIGGLAGIQVLYTWLTGLGKQRTFNRWLASQRIQQDTGDKQRELVSLQNLVAKLQSQIENDVPRSAKLIYLSNQRDELAHVLGEQYEEYKKITQSISALDAELDAEPLERPIKDNQVECVVLM